jgi:hypothetical protein
MKKLFPNLLRTALTGLALAASVGISQAQTFSQGADYNQNFDVGGNTANFSGSGSVSSWIYWYNTPGGNLPMTNDISLDQTGIPSSGSLIFGVPWSTIPTSANTQDVIFGSFGNGTGSYDQSVSADMTAYTNISFWIEADPTTAPRQVSGTNVDYGQIDVGFFYPYSFETVGTVTIPLSASNNWVQLVVPIPPTLGQLTGINGYGFNLSSYNGNNKYLLATNSIFYIDSILVHVGHPPAPPTLSAPYKPIPGFNALATTPGTSGQYNREQLVTAADTGYTFVGQPSVSYSWNITSFPANTGGNFQQHFFILNGAPGQYDQAADYNLADVFWITVSQSDAGAATMNFRLKTNEPAGNGMLFNTTPFSIVTNMDLSLTTNNPNMWPIEPIAAVTNVNGALGTWTVTIANGTNITMASPNGGPTTNFNITADQAALFADPVTLVLGGQPNNPNGAGLAVVYSSFTATGCTTPISDNFLTDTAFDTNTWKTTIANDTNGVVFVPGNAAYWVSWTVPDAGFALQTKADLNTTGGFTMPAGLKIRNNGKDQALVLSSDLSSPDQGYFQLIKFSFSQLQVLFDGQVSAPNTTLGYTGSPTPISGASDVGALANVTINATDSTFHIVPGITDVVMLAGSAGSAATVPGNASLVNGTLTEQVLFNAPGNPTVTATDVTNPSITAGVSAPIEVDP